MDRDDMVVDHGGGRPRLAGEAAPRGRTGGELGGEDLDGDGSPQARVERLENDAEATPAQNLSHKVRAQPAQRARGIRESEKVQGMVVLGRGPTLGRESHRWSFVSRRGELRQLGQEPAPGRKSLESAPATRAGIQVVGHLGVLQLGQVVIQERPQS